MRPALAIQVSLHDDNRPVRALAASVIFDAVRALTNTAEGAHYLMAREQAALFFARDDQGEVPCNLAWCCGILELDRQAIRDRLAGLTARKVNAAKRAIGQLARG